MRIHNNNKIVRGLTVDVKYDNVDRALRKLKKMIENDGRLDEARSRKHYVTPSEQKRLDKKAAILRHKRSLIVKPTKHK